MFENVPENTPDNPTLLEDTEINGNSGLPELIPNSSKHSFLKRVIDRVVVPPGLLLEDKDAFRAGAVKGLEQIGEDFESPPLSSAPDGAKTTDSSNNYKEPEACKVVGRLSEQEYIEKFTKKHLTPKKTRVSNTPLSSPDSVNDLVGSRARTSLQEQSETRANRRVDVIRSRRHEIEDYVRLYGDLVLPYNSDRLDNALEEGRFTQAQKRAIRKASRKVRRATQTIHNNEARLQKSALGVDIPGKAVDLRSSVTMSGLKKSLKALKREISDPT